MSEIFPEPLPNHPTLMAITIEATGVVGTTDNEEEGKK